MAEIGDAPAYDEAPTYDDVREPAPRAANAVAGELVLLLGAVLREAAPDDPAPIPRMVFVAGDATIAVDVPRATVGVAAPDAEARATFRADGPPLLSYAGAPHPAALGLLHLVDALGGQGLWPHPATLSADDLARLAEVRDRSRPQTPLGAEPEDGA